METTITYRFRVKDSRTRNLLLQMKYEVNLVFMSTGNRDSFHLFRIASLQKFHSHDFTRLEIFSLVVCLTCIPALKDGSRTADAADNGYDYKSLLHCIRLLYQAEEFLLTGHLTFPRPPAEIDHLMSIRHKQWPEGDFDLQQYILDWEDRIKKDIIPKSPLPKKPNWVKINRLCTELLRRAIIC